MKKTYTAPTVEAVELKVNQLLMASGVNSDLGVGFGGVDEDGVLDPAAPGLPSIEGMLGLPSFIFQ